VSDRRVIYGRQYFRTAHHLGAPERVALAAMLRTMEAEAMLPGPGDVKDVLAPTTPCWRRRIGASAWWLFYTLRDDAAVVVVAVAVPAYP